MKNMTSKKIADTGMGIALITLMLTAAFYLPGVWALAAFASGLPVVYLCVRHNAWVGSASVVCALVLGGILCGDFISVGLITLNYVFPALVLGILASKKVGFFGEIIGVSVAVLIGMVVEVLIISGGGDGISNVFSSYMKTVEDTIDSTISSAGIPLDGEMLGIIKSAVETATNQILLYLPTIIVAFSVVFAYVIMAINVFLMKRIKAGSIDFVKPNMLVTPKPLCFVTVILSLFSMLCKGDGILSAAFLNIAMLSEMAVGVCGFAFVDYKLSKVVKPGILRALIYGAALVVGFAILPLLADAFVIIGFADGLFRFRRESGKGGDLDENKQEE